MWRRRSKSSPETLNGHCLNDLLFRVSTGALNIEVPAIVANHRDFEPLAHSYGIPFHHIPVTPETKDEAEARLLDLVDELGVDMVLLARYMQILSDDLCKRLDGRAINIHHSLLPSYKGARPYHQAHKTLPGAGRFTAPTSHFPCPPPFNGSPPVAISVFDLFSIGIGPSSSHTVGPMRASRMFVGRLKKDGLLAQTASVRAELFGSLGATGHGHGTPKAVLLGLEGNEPHTVDVETADAEVQRITATRRLRLLRTDLGDAHEITFDADSQLLLHRRRSLPYHANGMTLFAYAAEGLPLLEKTYYSVCGGFVVDEDAIGEDRIKLDDTVLKHSFRTGDELLRLARETGLSVSALMLENEKAWRTEAEIREGLLEIWRVMKACVARGVAREGILPGGLKVRRRAATSARALRAEGDPGGHAME